MTSNSDYQPRAEHKFSFGLWTVGNRGRDAFGDAVRPHISPIDIVSMLAEVGAWGVNLHDNDLVPIDASVAEGARIVRSFKAACEANGIVVPMATVSLFFHPVFRDGAFTANDPEVRVCCSKNHAGDGHWSGTGREDFCLVGRPRGRRDRRLPPRG
jgi:xylose isomerase